MEAALNRPSYFKRASWSGYAVAVLCVAIAALLRVAAYPLLGPGFPFIFFFPAVMLSAWYGGTRPGTLATVLVTAIAPLFLEPVGAYTIDSPSDVIGLLLFLVCCMIISMFAGQFYNARARAEELNIELQQRMRESHELVDRLKEREAELRVSNERYQLASAAVTGVMYDWDLKRGRVERSAGIQTLLGFQPGETEPTPEWYLRRIHPDDKGSFDKALSDGLKSCERWNCEYRLQRKDGSWIHVWDVGLIACDEAGKPVRIVGKVIDISDRKALEQQRVDLLEREKAAREDAEWANQMKDEFLATLSHELRTPLTPIMGWTRILASGKCDEPTRAHGLTVIERNARAQARLVDDLLDISRVIAGKLRLNVQRFELVPVLEAAMETVRTAAEARDIRLKFDAPSRNAIIAGDPDRVQQIVWNLLSNAIKFTPRGGQVTLRLRQARNGATSSGSMYWEIQVQDSGEGIAPEFLPRVFERFTQADSSHSRAVGGLGIGLAIVRHLTELHGGTVRAQSEGTGKGATFTVLLPALSPAEMKDLTPRPRTGRGMPVLTDVSIVVVDDDQDARDFMQITLEQRGARVRAAGSVTEALELIRSAPPDVIVSDIAMPDEDGYALIRKLRELPAEQGGTTPTVALTAFARPEDRVRALESGFTFHVPKPVDPAELATVVATLSGRKR
ncbi:MAG TPA: ATP-binding protein [Planctomycetota bacterium]|nr:ATP-binding protein [Planctomycetota bacterium]